MIARYDGDGNPRISEFEHTLVSTLDNPWMHLAAKEEITTVNHKVGLGENRMVEYVLKVGKEIRTAADFLGTGPNGIVEPEVSVGKEDYAY